VLDDKNFVLLGIKYEAAVLGGVDAAGMAKIEEQLRTEAGDDWSKSPMIVRGRNAVRAEHGLPPLGAPPKRPVQSSVRRSLWRRMFGG